MALREVLAALSDRGVKKTANGWSAKCPSHEDAKASLTIATGQDQRTLLKCMAGCETGHIVEALGLTMADLFEAKDEPKMPPAKPRVVATYAYRDEQGTVLFEKLRYEPKDFRVRRADGHGGWAWAIGDARRVLYRLPEVLAKKDRVVFVVEGEKDADNLAALGMVATTTFDGAGGKWGAEYSEPLRGRRVVILPDNDAPGEKHALQVAQGLSGFAETITVLRLPGLPPKGDVSDWLAAGGTAEKLLALVNKQARQVRGFATSASRLIGEREERLELGRRRLSFGVRFLDDAMGGIMPNDIVLVGAKTGRGKTALVTSIAEHNGGLGKRVHYFALEAEEREIERRMKYRLLADAYYSNAFHRTHGGIRYLDWMSGDLDQVLGPFEEEADRKLGLTLARIKTFYRLDNFTGDDFAKQFAAIAEETDLAILDHLHYVDTEEGDENRGYKRIVKQIRDSGLTHAKPVIVVAHVRKGDRRYEPLIPTLEDFHGSSDISKIATKAIMIAGTGESSPSAPHLWPTYMQIGKCRTDGSVTNVVASLLFNAQTDRYEEEYDLGRLTDGGKVFSPLALADMPRWAIAGTETARRMRVG